MDNLQEKTKITVVKVKAKHLPIECPVCHGFGTLKYGVKVCQGCGGKGYVLVEAEETGGMKDG